MKKTIFTFIFIFSFTKIIAQDVEAILKESQKKEGFLTFYWHENKGKIYAEIKDLNTEFLYYPSLSRGLGSNDLGLDRGKLGQEHLLAWQKHGNKLLLVEPNNSYRAISSDPLEKLAVEESFAKSVLFGFEIIKTIDNKHIIDFTPFILRDALEASSTINQMKQGTYAYDATRSAVYAPYCRSFQDNTELEAIITISGTNPGIYVREIAPNTDNLTMHQHHSFVKLPPLDFKMRKFDPRIGYIPLSFYDYATPINQSLEKQYIVRHRLEKKDPLAVVSEPKKPIIYYLDPGTPEPIRSALLEGASWWNQAFEAAGYKDAFQVKMLPSDADPMDIRYNLIQWVHRSTRGWSYGTSVVDPRTGEILKGKVTLGSLRVRQDYLIAQGLLGNFDVNLDDAELLKMSLNRLRQLSAHEVGHTLGLPHNYISSTKNRASVMDYPHPMAEEINGKITLNNAYDLRIGDYDKLSIRYGYEDFPTGTDENKALENIIKEAQKNGLRFLTDQDARPDGSVSPLTHLWDNGTDPVLELNRLKNLRAKAISNFGLNKLKPGTPITKLEDVFVPIYMMHRFQVIATSKLIAGTDYNYVLKGDGQKTPQAVSGVDQLKALDAVLSTLDPDFLMVKPEILNLFSPATFGYRVNYREIFKRRTGMTFDPLGPAEASAQLSFSLLLENTRLNRLASQKLLDPSLPDLGTYFNRITKHLVEKLKTDKTQISQVLMEMYVINLLQIYHNKNNNASTKVAIKNELGQVVSKIQNEATLFKNVGFKAYIKDLIENPDYNKELFTQFFIAPDGQPIQEDPKWLGCED